MPPPRGRGCSILAGCRERCERYRYRRRPGGDWYLGDTGRCTSCDIFVRWEGEWCPCCGTKLRKKPRTSGRKRARKHVKAGVRRH